jgi:hypothetical protein
VHAVTHSTSVSGRRSSLLQNSQPMRKIHNLWMKSSVGNAGVLGQWCVVEFDDLYPGIILSTDGMCTSEMYALCRTKQILLAL